MSVYAFYYINIRDTLELMDLEDVFFWNYEQVNPEAMRAVLSAVGHHAQVQ